MGFVWPSASLSLADSSPAKAVNLLLKASGLQQLQKSDSLETSAEEIAKQAAQLAYSLFIKEQRYCRLALEAFKNYCTIVNENIDEELEYLYSVVLNDCGLASESKKLLEKIANRPTGNYRNRAKLELAVHSIHQRQYENPAQKGKLLTELSSLITDSNDCEHTGETMQLLAKVIDEIDRLQAQIDNFPEMMQDCKKIAEFCYNCHQNQLPGLLLAEIIAEFLGSGSGRPGRL